MDLQQVIAKTEQLLKQSQDPAMVEVHRQLKLVEAGQQPQQSIGRIIMYNYEPAPTPEIQEWAESVLAVSQALKGKQ